MGAQSSINGLIGTVAGAAVAGSNIYGKLSKNKEKAISDNKEIKKEEKKSGVDIKMAKKARKTVQDKINAVYANKELSNKAKTRRLGKLLDEYKGGE